MCVAKYTQKPINHKRKLKTKLCEHMQHMTLKKQANFYGDPTKDSAITIEKI